MFPQGPFDMYTNSSCDYTWHTIGLEYCCRQKNCTVHNGKPSTQMYRSTMQTALIRARKERLKISRSVGIEIIRQEKCE